MAKKKPDYASMFTLRKDGRYMATWTDDDGKRHSLYDRDPESLYERLQAAQSGEIGKRIPMFSEVAEEWGKKHWERIGWSTAQVYAPCLRRVTERFGSIPVDEVTAQMIQSFLAELGKKSYSRRTVQMHRDIINMIFNDAILSNVTRYNPCSAVSIPRNLPTSRRELPDDDAIRAVREMTDHPFSLFAQICLYAGLRRGEALALQYEDIDRANGVIHVTKAVEFISDAPHIKPPKTEAGVRDAILLDVLADRMPEKGSGFIFARDDGTPLTKTQYRKRWASYCKYIGHDITAHQLRHGFATILYEAGISDKDAQELMGHANISLTRNIYTHIRQTRRSETAARLNAFFDNNFDNTFDNNLDEF